MKIGLFYAVLLLVFSLIFANHLFSNIDLDPVINVVAVGICAAVALGCLYYIVETLLARGGKS